jgi:hypothetical protein
VVRSGIDDQSIAATSQAKKMPKPPRQGATESKITLQDALGALEKLLKMFSVERYVYLLMTALSFLLLLYSGYLLVASREADTATLVAIFGSSGLVAASSARICLFFDKSFRLIEKLIQKNTD